MKVVTVGHLAEEFEKIFKGFIMDKKILNQIAKQMVSDSKGILAIDESHGTCKKDLRL